MSLAMSGAASAPGTPWSMRGQGSTAGKRITARVGENGPVARVRIPTRVPLGLHGSWLPTQE
jgi:carotenoid cleavage dioxygenase-like enzyme